MTASTNTTSLNKDVFLAGLAVLAGAFGREVDGAVQRSYYQVLSQRLSTEDFERAVSLVLESETFWPSPATILSKVSKGDEAAGLAAFEHVNRVTGSHGGYRYLTVETFHREFDAPTKDAISAVGGLAVIGNTSEERWPSLQRKFAAAYVEALHPKLSAGESASDRRVARLVKSTAEIMNYPLSGRDRAAGRDE